MADPQPNGNTDPNGSPDPNLETILIAHVTANLMDGSSFELYPFVDANDVKSKVSELVGGWAESGFLLRGAHMVPWHQVKFLEATSVEEITRQEAQQRLLNWQAEDQRKAVQGFWKTKIESEEKKDGEKEQEGGEQQGGQ